MTHVMGGVHVANDEGVVVERCSDTQAHSHGKDINTTTYGMFWVETTLARRAYIHNDERRCQVKIWESGG